MPLNCRFLVLFGILINFLQVCFPALYAQQTRALKPVRVEAKTANNEEVSYIYAESHALVIGVSEYTNGWSRLPGVKEDVKEVSSALTENGFAVTVVENPTLEEMEIAIEDFIFEMGANADNRLLIYYAGHGHTMRLAYGGDMGFLVPSDAPTPKKGRENRFQRQALSMQRIEEVAKSTAAKHVLFMFDACFAGSVFLATRAAPAYIELNTKEPVRQFITSGSAEQEVPDKSIFRRAFVDALQGKADYDKDGYLTGSELGSYIQKRTAEDWEGKLTPQYGKLQDPNLNKGDFVFELAKPEPVVVTKSEPAEVEEIPEFDLGNLQQEQEKLNKLRSAFKQVEELEKSEGGINIKRQAWERFQSYAKSLNIDGLDYQKMFSESQHKITFLEMEEARLAESLNTSKIEMNSNSYTTKESDFNWTEYLEQMEDSYTEILINSQFVSVKERIRNWQTFLQDFRKDNPDSKLDNQWREQAIGAIEILENQEAKRLDYKFDPILYQKIITESQETLGCGFFYFGCKDPLKLPPFNENFHLKSYKRVTLWANNSEWINTEINVKSSDLILLYGTGEASICQSGCLQSGLQNLAVEPLFYHIDNEAFPKKIKKFTKKGDGHISELNADENGTLHLIIADWDSYPPKKNNYSDNSGNYLIDIFVIERNKRKNFENFFNSLAFLNSEDENIISFNKPEFLDSSRIKENAKSYFANFFTYNGKLYATTKTKLNWNTAVLNASKNDGVLAFFESSEENYSVASFLRENTKIDRVGIGFSDHITEGKWEWQTDLDKKLNYTNWARGEPNDFKGREDYAQMFIQPAKDNPSEKYSGKWNDGGDYEIYLIKWEDSSTITKD